MNAGLRAALADARRRALTEYVIDWCRKLVASIKPDFNRAVKDAGLDGVTSVVAARCARGSGSSGRVIECELLSGLCVRHCQGPLAGMVKRGSGPSLQREL